MVKGEGREGQRMGERWESELSVEVVRLGGENDVVEG